MATRHSLYKVTTMYKPCVVVADVATGEPWQRKSCVVVSRLLHEPYTGKAIPFRKADAIAVQIDHVVPARPRLAARRRLWGRRVSGSRPGEPAGPRRIRQRIQAGLRAGPVSYEADTDGRRVRLVATRDRGEAGMRSPCCAEQSGQTT